MFSLQTDTHVVLVSEGADTSLYLNGVNVFTFSGTPLAIAGDQGLAGIYNSDGSFNDLLDGTILGFASYDSALTASEIQTHSNAFSSNVPEPGSFASAVLGGLAVGAFRRRLV